MIQLWLLWQKKIEQESIQSNCDNASKEYIYQQYLVVCFFYFRFLVATILVIIYLSNQTTQINHPENPYRTLDGILVLRCFFCNTFQTTIEYDMSSLRRVPICRLKSQSFGTDSWIVEAIEEVLVHFIFLLSLYFIYKTCFTYSYRWFDATICNHGLHPNGVQHLPKRPQQQAVQRTKSNNELITLFFLQLVPYHQQLNLKGLDWLH